MIISYTRKKMIDQNQKIKYDKKTIQIQHKVRENNFLSLSL